MKEVSSAVPVDGKGKETFSSRRAFLPRWLTPDRRFLLLFAILIVSVGWSVRAHRQSIAREMQYIPRDAAMVLASGPIKSVWSAFDDHFGPVIRSSAPGPDGKARGLAKIIEDARSNLAKDQIEVRNLSDLSNHGIDASRGVLLGIHRTHAFVTVVPILTSSAFKKTFQHFVSGKAAKETRIPGVAATTEVVTIGDFYLAFPEPGIALISDNPEFLGRSLRNRVANLEYARNNDDLYDSIRRCLGRPLSSGPTVFAFTRLSGIPAIVNAGIGLELRNEDVLLKMQLDVNSNLKLIDELLNDAPTKVPWPTKLPNDTASAIAIHQEALGPIFGRLGSTNVRGLLESLYGGFLWSLRDPGAGLSHVVIAVTGYRNGLPEILTGIWGDQKHLESKLQEMRIKFRRERDLEIVTALKATETPSGAPTTLLSPEPNATFTRYTLGPNGVYDGTPKVEDFENETYVVKTGDRTIYYLAPRPTVNDRRFRKGFEKLTDAELADTSAVDRYRMAYVSQDGATWIATDAMDLRALLGRKSDDLAHSPYFRSSTRHWHAQDKVEVFLHVDQLAKLGLLSPESEIQDFVKDCLLELREHPAISAELRRCTGRRECLRLSTHLVRRNALR